MATSTIDILEECLDLIYKIRKTSLNKRIAASCNGKTPKYIPRNVIHNKEFSCNDDRNSPIDDSGSRSPSKSSSTSLANQMNNRMMSDFNEYHQSKQQQSNEINNNNNNADELESDKRIVKFMDRKNQSSTMTKANVNATELKNNVISPGTTNSKLVHPSIITILQDFKKELKEWWATSATIKRGDEDAREEYADFLTEKYMCQKLDVLPPSESISKIRKEVCNTIENFAMDGSINFRKLDNLVQQQQTMMSQTLPQAQSSLQRQSVINTTTDKSSISLNSSSSGISQSVSMDNISTINSNNKTVFEDKGTGTDKAKIRDQYSAYLKTRGML